MSLLQVAVAVDQFFNALTGGYADETLSARAYRCQPLSKKWTAIRKVIDFIFFWQPEHCRKSYESEIKRRQLSSEYSS